MPTYDYKCPQCDTLIECFHSMNENPKITCEKCHIVMTRMIGKGSGVHFKGEGWTPKFRREHE